MSIEIAAQLIGALLNMGAFALLHFEIAPSSALRYLVPNLLGSIILVVCAYAASQWGVLTPRSRMGGGSDARDPAMTTESPLKA